MSDLMYDTASPYGAILTAPGGPYGGYNEFTSLFMGMGIQTYAATPDGSGTVENAFATAAANAAAPAAPASITPLPLSNPLGPTGVNILAPGYDPASPVDDMANNPYWGSMGEVAGSGLDGSDFLTTGDPFADPIGDETIPVVTSAILSWEEIADGVGNVTQISPDGTPQDQAPSLEEPGDWWIGGWDVNHPSAGVCGKVKAWTLASGGIGLAALSIGALFPPTAPVADFIAVPALVNTTVFGIYYLGFCGP
jgi:hypothetical protein